MSDGLVIVDWRAHRAGKLIGFATVEWRGLRIKDIKVFEGTKGPFPSMPSTSWEARDGSKRYTSIIEFVEKQDEWDFKDALIEELEERGAIRQQASKRPQRETDGQYLARPNDRLLPDDEIPF